MEINDYPNYLIYDDGRVFSKTSNKFLKTSQDRKGYCVVNLRTYKKPKTFRLHRLVALYYIPNPNNYPQIDHIDRIKTNNNISNLRWCNNSMNQENIGLKKNNKLKQKYISISTSKKNNKIYYSYRICKLSCFDRKISCKDYTLQDAIKLRDELLIKNNIV
tara:strand:- start:75 stop:557 length:483 start_codon:yes stop_codon:yes gene_type:complete